jgi:hypothetical protein
VYFPELALFRRAMSRAGRGHGVLVERQRQQLALMLNSASEVPAWPVVPAHCSPVPPHCPVEHWAGLALLQLVRSQMRPIQPDGRLKLTEVPGAICQPPF